MSSASSVSLFARMLIALERTQATGTLRVQGLGSGGAIGIVGGRPGAVSVTLPEREQLTDWLDQRADFDHAKYSRALLAGGPTQPIGQWLVEHGIASEGAVSFALRVQLRRRFARLFALRAPCLDFDRGVIDAALVMAPEPPAASDLVLRAARALARGVPAVRQREFLGDGRLALSRLGEALVAGAPLLPPETSIAAALARGARIDHLLAVGGGGRVATSFLYAMKLVGGVRDGHLLRGAGATLLRVRRNVRRGAGPHELLELDQSSTHADARRAMKRLASVIHPDRFEACDPTLRRVSGETMSAVLTATSQFERGRFRGR